MQALPRNGLAADAVIDELRSIQAEDIDWAGGKCFGLVYHAGDDVVEVARRATDLFLMTNGLSPAAFPSLRRMENDVVAWTAGLLHAPEDAAGSLTTGGTESILMAVKAARDWARAERPDVATPEVILPGTAHPAFDKAAAYLGLRAVHVPTRDDFRADPAAMRAAVTDATVLVVGSAPCFSQGVIDPIPEIAAIARERGILCHVDACLGGFVLPFLERAPGGYEGGVPPHGRPLPPFDFRVPGVTSMSADLHKFGYAPKGVSAILYRDRALRRRQFFAYSEYPGGVYGTPTLTGARAGAPIAAAWAVLRYLGEAGFVARVRAAVRAARRLMDGVRAIPGLRVLGEPDACVFSFTSDAADIYAIGEALSRRGWYLDRQQLPPSLHLTVSPVHERAVEPFLADLRAVVSELAATGPTADGAAAMYGMLATIPDRSSVSSFVIDFLDGLG